MLHQRLKTVQTEAEDDDNKWTRRKTVKPIEAIIQVEHCKEAYEKIRMAARQMPMGGGLDKLDVPKRREQSHSPGEERDINNEWGTEEQEILLDINDIHKVLLEKN
jgi:hypothetical protein